MDRAENIRRLKEAKNSIKKEKKPIRKRSKKMEDMMALLRLLYPPFLERKKMCEVVADGCTHKATAVHHSKSRGKENILNVATWVAVCQSCHNWCEDSDADAREAGFKESKF